MIDTSLYRNRPVSGLISIWNSSVGKKFVMALTGIILFGYVVLHLWGNLKIFYGPETINNWGVFLRVFGDPVFTNSEVLWAVRVVLLASLVLHVTAAYQLARQDYAGRPVAYAMRRNLESNYASRTMRWGGTVILLFIIFHVLDLTTGTLHPNTFGRFQEGNIYDNVVGSFRVWYVALIYLVSVLALGMHLYHGVWSMFQTLGINSSRADGFWRNFAICFSVILTTGNVAIPVAVLTGVVR